MQYIVHVHHKFHEFLCILSHNNFYINRFFFTSPLIRDFAVDIFGKMVLLRYKLRDTISTYFINTPIDFDLLFFS